MYPRLRVTRTGIGETRTAWSVVSTSRAGGDRQGSRTASYLNEQKNHLGWRLPSTEPDEVIE